MGIGPLPDVRADEGRLGAVFPPCGQCVDWYGPDSPSAKVIDVYGVDFSSIQLADGICLGWASGADAKRRACSSQELKGGYVGKANVHADIVMHPELQLSAYARQPSGFRPSCAAGVVGSDSGRAAISGRCVRAGRGCGEGSGRCVFWKGHSIVRSRHCLWLRNGQNHAKCILGKNLLDKLAQNV